MSKNILFLLGSANISGGTYVILQHAYYLKKLGHRVTVALVYMTQDDFLDLKNSPLCWHPAIQELTFISIEDAKNYHFDIAIFTWWATLTYFEKVRASAFIYFIQSIESRFYFVHQTFLRDLVERTYQFGLPVITEATWIKKYLENKYNNSCMLVRNGILKEVYCEEGPALAEKSPHQLRILVEGPFESAFKNMPKTIELCLKANVGEVWLLTSSDVREYPGVSKVFSRVPISDVPAIYRSCDVLVKLSYVEGMFGPPLEIFHCGGTAIVYDVTGHDEYIEHNVNALVAKTDDEDQVISYLQMLHQDRSLLQRLTEGAKKTAQEWRNWEVASEEFNEALDILSQKKEASNYLSLLTHVQHSLYEHLEVIALTRNTVERNMFAATPLYQNGFYSLKLSVHTGESQIQILFGKKYRRFLITNVQVYSNNGAGLDGTMNLTFQDISQDAHQIFTCVSHDAAITILTNLQLKDFSDDASISLEITFHPIEIKTAVVKEGL